MRIAFDATPLLGQRTGIGAFVAGAFTALRSEPGLELVGYGLTWSGRRQLPTQLPAGVRPCRVPMVAGPLMRIWSRSNVPTIEWWTGKIDAVHGTNFVVPPARRAAEIVTVHDLTPLRFPELCTPTSLAYPGLIRRALGRGAVVHTPSATIAAEVVEEFGVTPDRVRAVPHGIPGNHCSPLSAPSEPEQPPYILALGTVEPRKDFPTLVRAFDSVAATHADVRLVIAGPPAWGASALDEAIAVAHHSDRIERRGWVSDDERTRLLRGASIFAFPSIYEGFGLPPLEAMAEGVPVVATAAGAVPEVVGTAALLVDIGDVDELSGALTTVLDDEEERARLVKAGSDRIRDFTWERCAQGLAALYRDAAAAKG